MAGTGKDRLNETTTSVPASIIGAELLEFSITMHVLYAVVFVLSVVGNSMVINVTVHSRAFRKSSYMLLILNLAVCDLLTPMISIPFDIAQTENGEEYLFGVVMCKLLWPLETLFSTSSSLTLAVICYDRYRALTKPFKGPTSFHRVKLWISLIHFTSFLLVVPYFTFLQHKPSTQSCEEEWPAAVYKQAYTMLLFLVQYAVPLAFMVVMYPTALFSLFSSARKMSTLEARVKNGAHNEVEHSRSFVSQRRRQNRRVTKMFIVVVVVFAISMFPNQLLWLWGDYGDGYQHLVNFNRAAVICRLFTYSNSVLNPVIYCFYNQEFRAGFLKICSRLCLRSRRMFRKAHTMPSTCAPPHPPTAGPNYPTTAESPQPKGTGKVKATGMIQNGMNQESIFTVKQPKRKELVDSTPPNELLEFVDFVSKIENSQALLEHFKNLQETTI